MEEDYEDVSLLPTDELRCSRHDGKLWRCKNWRIHNKSLCQVHYFQLRAKSNAGASQQGRNRRRKNANEPRNQGFPGKRRRGSGGSDEESEGEEIPKEKKRRRRNREKEDSEKLGDSRKEVKVNTELGFQDELSEDLDEVEENEKKSSSARVSRGLRRGGLSNRGRKKRGVNESEMESKCSFHEKKIEMKVKTEDLRDSDNVEKKEKEKGFGFVGRTRLSNYSLRASTESKQMDLGSNKRRKGNGKEEDSLMCHQCQRNDKGRVVRCQACHSKRYCVPCIQRWYPQLEEEAMAEACPFCRGNCNCKACLRTVKDRKNSDVQTSKDEKFQHSKYILHVLLPILNQFHQEQMMEKEMEAGIKGLLLKEIKLQKTDCQIDERIYCNHCKTSIVDFHRSCPNCSYDLCLTCCRELRDLYLQGTGEEVIMQYTNSGKAYMHGGSPVPVRSGQKEDLNSHFETDFKDHAREISVWKAENNGSISCPPTEMGGCGHGFLELKCIFPENWVTKLKKKAEKIAKVHKFRDLPGTST